MFRAMRRNKQELSQDDCYALLDAATSGVLSVLGDDGYPYGVPLSYSRIDDTLIFHSATSGHKIDAIQSCPRASFTVVAQNQVVPEEYTTYYRSVIAFGRVSVVQNREEKLVLLRHLGNRYWPNHDKECDEEIAPRLDHMHVLKFEIEHMTGKQAKELMPSS